jgi:hypothetical protein
MQAAAANLIKFVRTEMTAYRLYTVRPQPCCFSDS